MDGLPHLQDTARGGISTRSALVNLASASERFKLRSQDSKTQQSTSTKHSIRRVFIGKERRTICRLDCISCAYECDGLGLFLLRVESLKDRKDTSVTLAQVLSESSRLRRTNHSLTYNQSYLQIVVVHLIFIWTSWC